MLTKLRDIPHARIYWRPSVMGIADGKRRIGDADAVPVKGHGFAVVVGTGDDVRCVAEFRDIDDAIGLAETIAGSRVERWLGSHGTSSERVIWPEMESYAVNQ